MKHSKIKFIHNPKSGLLRAPTLLRKAIEVNLAEASFDYDFTETTHRDHAVELTKQAIDEGYDTVVAVGGDGTVNEVAKALLHTDVNLGIIPVGSGNGLARGVDIPMSLRKATKLLLNGKVRKIDAGRINDKTFFIVTGVGLDAIIGKLFNDQKLRGPLPYFTIGFREFFFYRPEVFILKFNGKQIAVPALLVTIANQKGWGAGAVIAPHAEPDDGLLDICIIHRVNFLYGAFHLPKIFLGKIDKVRKYERYQAKEVQIIRERPGPFHYDGEHKDAGTILNVSLEEKALNIIVPRKKDKK
jgi:diacylglycerol kinase (ATP)